MKQQLSRYHDRQFQSAGGLLARITSGARSLGSSKITHKECWRMMVSAEYSTAACQQLLQGCQLTPPGQATQPASHSSAADPQQFEQQQEAQASDPDTSASEAGIQLEVPPDHVPQQTYVVCREGCNWLVSLVCEVQPPADQQPGTSSAPGAAERADVVLNAATVAVCTSWKRSQSTSSAGGSADVSSRTGILPLGGAFSGAALPGKAGGVLGQQRFLLDIQGTGAAAAYASAASQPAAAAADASATAAAATPGAGLQLRRRISIRDADVDAKARAAMAVLVSAWHELLVGFTGAGQQLYGLLPDLLAAVQAGDTAAAYAFKQVRYVSSLAGGSGLYGKARPGMHTCVVVSPSFCFSHEGLVHC
jgi:hypothetical protein